ncbi:MAG: hypothetical protein L6R28_03580 [Planctomycetes bacterium]|nr:hypothetical protein [Planctomycetota bacterium]
MRMALVVHQDPGMLHLLNMIALQEGFTALTAASRGEALGIALSRASSIELVIAEHSDNLDAIELLSALLSFLPRARLLILSGDALDETLVQFADPGNCEVLPRWNTPALQDAIGRLFYQAA